MWIICDASQDTKSHAAVERHTPEKRKSHTSHCIWYIKKGGLPNFKCTDFEEGKSPHMFYTKQAHRPSSDICVTILSFWGTVSVEIKIWWALLRSHTLPNDSKENRKMKNRKKIMEDSFVHGWIKWLIPCFDEQLIQRYWGISSACRPVTSGCLLQKYEHTK